MKMQIVAIRDIVANVYSQPQFTNSLGAAIRSFGDSCRDKQHPIGQHPGDYELYHLGEYDDGDASFVTDHPPRQIAVGANYITN